MTFDEFTDQVETRLMSEKGWSEMQVADFVSPRTIRMIQAYQDGDSVEKAAAKLLDTPPAQQHDEQAIISDEDLEKLKDDTGYTAMCRGSN